MEKGISRAETIQGKIESIDRIKGDLNDPGSLQNLDKFPGTGVTARDQGEKFIGTLGTGPGSLADRPNLKETGITLSTGESLPGISPSDPRKKRLEDSGGLPSKTSQQSSGGSNVTYAITYSSEDRQNSDGSQSVTEKITVRGSDGTSGTHTIESTTTNDGKTTEKQTATATDSDGKTTSETTSACATAGGQDCTPNPENAGCTGPNCEKMKGVTEEMLKRSLSYIMEKRRRDAKLKGLKDPDPEAGTSTSGKRGAIPRAASDGHTDPSSEQSGSVRGYTGPPPQFVGQPAPVTPVPDSGVMPTLGKQLPPIKGDSPAGPGGETTPESPPAPTPSPGGE